MKLCRYILFAAVVAVGFSANAAETLLGIPGERSTSIGLYIKDLKSGRVIVERNADVALTPASTMKALTTATALSVIGEDYVFVTPARLEGRREGTSWRGNLVIESCGDPTVESENFKERLGFCDSIVAGLRRLGITRIEGDIIIRETLSDAGPVAQWEIEDVAWPYGAGLYGMNYMDNTFTLYPATGKTRPYVPDLKVTCKKGRGNDLSRGVHSNHLVVWGKNPTNKKWAVRTTMPNPAAVAAHALGEKLKAAQIAVVKKAVKFGADSMAVTVYEHHSAKSGEIMKSLMFRSDNLFAEGMLRAISPGDSRADAIEREKDVWHSRGFDVISEMVINDGSGLTRGNGLSPHFLGDLLEWMAKSEYAGSYVSYFPRAGVDGTMKSFAAETHLKGFLAFKTGSVSGVQCYAGYKLDSDGKPTHVVVVMVNGFSCRRPLVKSAVENLMLRVFE